MGDFQQIPVSDFRSVHPTPHYMPGCDMDSRGSSGYSRPLKGSLGTSYLCHLLGVDRVLDEDINTVCCLDFSCETQLF